MDMPAKKPLYIKLIVFVVALIIFLVGFILLADWFYKSDVLMENKSAQYIRRRMDYAFYYAYIDNTLGYRDYVFSGAPGYSVWRPFRVIPDMEGLPEAWDGTTEFNTVFGEVMEWDPYTDILYTIISLPSPNRLYLHMTEDVKIIIPQFDEIGQPLPPVPVDLNYVTDYSLTRFFTHHDTFDSAYELVNQFVNSVEATEFIADNFSGLDPSLQFKESGPYEWEYAFCKMDNIQISFDKSLDIKALEHDATVVPKLVIVNQAGCLTEYTEEELQLPVPQPPLPELDDRDAWLDLYNSYKALETNNE